MAQETSGTPTEYSDLVNSLAASAANRVGLTGDKLEKANDVLNKINAANLGLQQFGFYKKITEALKNTAQETADELKSKIGASKTPLGQEGTELTEVAKAEEAVPSQELITTQKGIMGRQILGERPNVGDPVSSDTTENIPVSDAQSSFESLTRGYVPLENRPKFSGVERPSADQPLFPDEAGLPQLEFESRAPLFFGKGSGRAGVRARGGVPEPQEEPQPPARPVETQPEGVSDVPLEEPELQTGETLTSQEVAPLARAALAQQLSRAELSQSIQTGGITSKITGAVKQFQEFQGAFEDGVSRVNQLRVQATQVGQQLKDAATQKLAQGRQMIQDGQDALTRGEAGAQDLINQGQGVVDDALKQASNSDLVQSQISSAKNLYSQGQTLLSEGKTAGLQLIEQGNEQIKTAQAAIQGYGSQAQALQQSLQTELDTRVGQLQDLASKVASTAGEGAQLGQNVAKAAMSGDIQGTVEAGQQFAKFGGNVAGQLGSETGEKIASGISEALPVAGEVVGAGLFLASLFTGIAEAFVPHERVPIYTTSFQSGL
jgi:hypothetical protein